MNFCLTAHTAVAFLFFFSPKCKNCTVTESTPNEIQLTAGSFLQLKSVMGQMLLLILMMGILANDQCFRIYGYAVSVESFSLGIRAYNFL